MVDFRHLNLIKDFSAIGTFDIVYCRNVLIYFDGPTKTDVPGLANAMAPGRSFSVPRRRFSASPIPCPPQGDPASHQGRGAAGADLPRLAVARWPGRCPRGLMRHSWTERRSEDRVQDRAPNRP